MSVHTFHRFKTSLAKVKTGLRLRHSFSFVPVKTLSFAPLQFPSCPLPLCENESSCETIHMKMCFVFKFIFMQIKLICIRKFGMKTCFETEAKGSSEMAY